MVMTQELVYTDNIYKEPPVITSKLFLNNTTQAVRLPKEVAFPPHVSEVEIIVQGNNRLLVPKKDLISWMLESPGFTDDFTTDPPENELPPREFSWDEE